MSVFNLSMETLRIGCGKLTIAKRVDGRKVIKVSHFQLENWKIGSSCHHVHLDLDVISYPPHKRAAMAQSVGVLTHKITLNRRK